MLKVGPIQFWRGCAPEGRVVDFENVVSEIYKNTWFRPQKEDCERFPGLNFLFIFYLYLHFFSKTSWVFK